MGRCPASASRTRIHAGAGATRKPSKRWATKRVQSGDSIVDVERVAGRSACACRDSPATARAAPGRTTRRARAPGRTTDIASTRLLVTSTSSTAASSPSSATTSVPGDASGSSCRIPSSNHSGGKRQLAGGDHHALRRDAAHLARLDRQLRQPRADRRDRNRLAGRDVGRRGRDRQRTVARRLRPARPAAGRRWDASRPSTNRADDDAGNARAPHDLLDGKAEHRQTLGDSFGIAWQVDVLTQPADRNEH